MEGCWRYDRNRMDLDGEGIAEKRWHGMDFVGDPLVI